MIQRYLDAAVRVLQELDESVGVFWAKKRFFQQLTRIVIELDGGEAVSAGLQNQMAFVLKIPHLIGDWICRHGILLSSSGLKLTRYDLPESRRSSIGSGVAGIAFEALPFYGFRFCDVALMRRNADSRQDRSHTADGLNPRSLLGSRESTPANPVAVHVTSLVQWGNHEASAFNRQSISQG
ncbi:hypothetical protein ACFQS6_17670 [Xanthomonas populi]